MTLKATNKEEVSDGIIISFHGKWLTTLSSGAVGCVFRKRGPQHMIPHWIYVYVGTPMKAIAGRLPVKKVEVVSVKECIRLASEGAIGRDELAKYANGYKELFVFWVGNYQLANHGVDFAYLNSRHGFTPPQSFLLLSEQGKRRLDELCGF